MPDGSDPLTYMETIVLSAVSVTQDAPGITLDSLRGGGGDHVIEALFTRKLVTGADGDWRTTPDGERVLAQQAHINRARRGVA